MKKFWKTVLSIDGFGEPGAKTKTVAAQPVVLKALAKLAFDLSYGHQNIKDHDGYKKLLNSISSGELDFSHNNPIWSSLMLSNEKRLQNFPGINDYIYVPEGTNLDAGVFDDSNKWVRFGNRHNDIFPRLGDAIRYKIGIEPRPSVTKALEQR